MTGVYLGYSHAKGVLADRRAAFVTDLADARAYAEPIVRSLIMQPGLQDWRSWVVQFSDDLGSEMFPLPFASLLGKLY